MTPPAQAGSSDANPERDSPDRDRSGTGPAGTDRAIAWGFVAAQFGLILALILLPGAGWTMPAWTTTLGRVLSLTGIAIMVAGALNLGRALTPLPLPNGAGRLRTGGLYRLVRHPIYAGLLTFGVGQAVSEPSAVRIAAAIGLIVLINFKARWEEERLVTAFPEYPQYTEVTPRFVPSLRLLRKGSQFGSDPGHGPAN